MQKRLKICREPPNLFSSLQQHKDLSEDAEVDGEEYATQTLLAITDTLEGDRIRSDAIRESANTSQITSWNQHNLQTLNYTANRHPTRRPRLRIRERKQLSREYAYLENKSLLTQLQFSVKVQPQRAQLALREKTENSQHFMTLDIEKERVKSKRQIMLEIINCKHQITPFMTSNIKKSRLGWKQLGFVKENDQTRQYQSIRKKQSPPLYKDNQKENEDFTTRQMSSSHTIKGSLKGTVGLTTIKGRSLKKMFSE